MGYRDPLCQANIHGVFFDPVVTEAGRISGDGGDGLESEGLP